MSEENFMFDLEEPEEEPLPEMDGAVKLAEQGYAEEFLTVWGDKPIFKTNGEIRLDFFKRYVDWCETLTTLGKINYLLLDEKQRDYWKDKKKSIQVAEEVDLTVNPKVDMYEAEPEPTKETTEELLDRYIGKNRELIAKNNELKEIRSKLVIETTSLTILSRELVAIFAKLGITEDITPESEKTLEGLY